MSPIEEPTQVNNTLERIRPLPERVENAYQMAIKQNQSVTILPADEVRSYLEEIIREIDKLEEVGRRDPGLRGISAELADSIGAIWTISGPGTYYEPILNENVGYAEYKWTHGMDRARLNYTARLARKVTEGATGIVHKAVPSTIEPQVQKTKQTIADFGPHIIYNGVPSGNAAVREVLSKEHTVVPEERVSVLGEDIKNTVDQMKTFRLPDGALEGGKKIAVVAHAPQLSRVVRMINRYRPFPEGTQIVLFPLATPGGGGETYAAREACALVYYTYLSPARDATREPYPYKVYEPE